MQLWEEVQFNLKMDQKLFGAPLLRAAGIAYSTPLGTLAGFKGLGPKENFPLISK